MPGKDIPFVDEDRLAQEAGATIGQNIAATLVAKVTPMLSGKQLEITIAGVSGSFGGTPFAIERGTLGLAIK